MISINMCLGNNCYIIFAEDVNKEHDELRRYLNNHKILINDTIEDYYIKNSNDQNFTKAILKRYHDEENRNKNSKIKTVNPFNMDTIEEEFIKVLKSEEIKIVLDDGEELEKNKFKSENIIYIDYKKLSEDNRNPIVLYNIPTTFKVEKENLENHTKYKQFEFYETFFKAHFENASIIDIADPYSLENIDEIWKYYFDKCGLKNFTGTINYIYDHSKTRDYEAVQIFKKYKNKNINLFKIYDLHDRCFQITYFDGSKVQVAISRGLSFWNPHKYIKRKDYENLLDKELIISVANEKRCFYNLNNRIKII